MEQKINSHENPEVNEGVAEDFSDIETPEELRPHTPVVRAQKPAHPFPPPLDRERPPRPPVIPQRVWIIAGAVLLVVALGAAIALWVSLAGRVAVPEVVGLDQGVAKVRINQVGLGSAVVEERFSTQPKGEVLEQRPEAGTEVAKGDTVSLVVSAGTEEFVMPDVIGDGLTLARGVLEERGLVVEVETVISDQPSDTVLASFPAPGALVRIGDAVRLQVASPRPDGVGLRPYRMQGLAVTIDPGLPVPQKADLPLDVARRLRALLEASGATVVVLRSSGATATSDADRGAAALESSGTVAVGLSVAQTGPGGRLVASSSGAAAPSSAQVRDAIVSQLATAAPPASATTATADPVLDRLTIPWVRVSLGSYSVRADETSFADPSWADAIARSLYVGLGEVYGTREGL